jgi:hypothetical protein
MEYENWPDLARQCPLCEGGGCAIYRGYYTRFVFCSEMEFFGRVAIRTGYCKRWGGRFTLFPDFLIRYLRISLLGYLALLESFKLHRNHLKSAIDECLTGLPDEFYLPISTAHFYLKLKITVPP